MAKLQSVNSVAGKETLYVDVDDEITAIIDKVDAAKGKVVALVLPKRCPVLQSVVNMKLLKRTADNNGKNLVLVTSEAGLIPLAGAIGLYVASTPTSRPVIPDVPGSVGDEAAEELEEPLRVVDGSGSEASDADDFNPQSVAGTSVGDLAASAKKSSLMSDETIDMNDMEDAEDAAEVAPAVADAAKKVKTPKPKKDKKLKVPNFEGFRKWMVLGILAIVILIAAIIFALTVLPKATITIATDSNTIPTNLTLTLDTTATSLDTTSDTVPAVSQSQQKTSTGTAQATGQQNNGQKATGSVTVTDCTSDNSAVTMPTGSTITSGSNTYVLDGSVQLNYSGVHHGSSCQSTPGVTSATVNITALQAGTTSNTSGNASFSSSSEGSSVDITGSANGGSDNIITIVQQSDITNAQNKATSESSSSIKQQLEQSIEAQGLQPVLATFLTGSPQTSANQQAGAQASSVTVTVNTTYSMMGVKKSYLQTLIDSNVNGQLDKGKQTILDDGAVNAQFAEANSGTNTSATVAMTASSKVGPRISVTALKAALAGKRSADVQSYVEQTPGVTNVTVKFSPFYVDTVPSKASKVQINIVKASS